MSLADVVDIRTVSQHKDDFTVLNTSVWTDVNDGATGTGAILTTAGSGGGVLAAVTTATANDYHSFSGPLALECLAGRPWRAAVRMKITEASANSSHWFFGVTNTTTAGGFTATTGVPVASYKGACFYKPAGAAVVKTQGANGSTKTDNAAAAVFVSGSWLEMAIEFDPGDGVTGKFSFLYNGQPTSASFVPIPKQPVALSGLAPMGLLFGVMASTAAVETLLVDFAGWEITR